MSPVPADPHQPMVVLNPGPGIRTFYGCRCGFLPDPPPISGDRRATGYHTHRAQQGLPYMHGVAHAVFGPGYPGEGLTWRQWHTAHPGIDPFTGEILNRDLLLPPRADHVGFPDI